MRKILFIMLVFCCSTVIAADVRYITGDVVRDDNGDIVRDQKAVYAFRKEHRCPVTGLTWGACPGWAVDHVIPLACGGKDEMVNMQWLPDEIKSAAGTLAKDRWERDVYCK